MIPCDPASITVAENEKIKFVGLLQDAELAASLANNEEDKCEGEELVQKYKILVKSWARQIRRMKEAKRQQE